MLEFRRIGPLDVESVTDLAMKALAMSDDLPLHPSRPKVRHVVAAFATDGHHFQMAAFDGARAVGAVAMVVAEMPFHERFEGHVMMCYASVVGAGMPLVRSMMDFVRADMKIQRVIWAMNDQPDPRFAKMVARCFGFSQRLDTFVFYKGASL